ncbi:unnamed protein product [Lymnaea stagnalis]|uniref:Serine racemase n=1 Tax=Lymnaea stagnalis TaxID=6523 RepID=A0AAV2IBM4_LYMST
MSNSDCCGVKGDFGSKLSSSEACRRPPMDQDQDSFLALCANPACGAQHERKKDACCPSDLSNSDRCDINKDGFSRCRGTVAVKNGMNGHCVAEDFKHQTCHKMRGDAKEESCSPSECASDDRNEAKDCAGDPCEAASCGRSGGHVIGECCDPNVGSLADCVQNGHCPSSNKDVITKKANQGCDRRCERGLRTSDRCEQRVKGTSHSPTLSCENGCDLAEEKSFKGDKTNACASSCCRDKVCEKECGSPTEERCCGNDVRTPDCGDVKDVYCDPENPVIINFKQICEARERIASYTKKTPCERSDTLSEVLGLHLFFKKDFIQPTGSFKVRGAFNALAQLSEDQRERGVIAASAGNHALALAYAGTKLNIPVTVVMPANATLMKIQKCRELNARVELCGQDFGEAKRYAMQVGKARGLLYVNGYDHPDILAGQGTMGCEIFEQLPHIDAIVVPVGGGGLIAGVSAALKHLKPDVEIYGVESEKSTGFKSAMEAGRPVMTKVSKSLAEGLSVPEAGVNALVTAMPLITELVTVKEDSIVTAMMQLLEKEKIVVEGAGAAGLAAIIEGKFPQLKGKTVVVILCGANIDMSVMRHVIEKGLTLQSKMMRFEVELPDTPGALAMLTALVGGQGASFKHINIKRDWVHNDVFSGKVTCVVETRDTEHAKKFEEVIRSHYLTCHF